MHERIHFGARAGISLNRSQFDAATNPDVLSETSPGWSVGGVVSYRIDSRYSIKAEIGYTLAGSKYTDDSLHYSNRLHLQLVDFRLAANRRYPVRLGRKNSDFHIGISPTVSYWLGSNGTMTYAGGNFDYDVVFGSSLSQASNILYAQGINRWLFGAEVSVGLMVPVFRRQRLLLELRGLLGLTPLAESPILQLPLTTLGNPDTYFLNQRVHSLTFSVSYTFAHNRMASKLGASNKDKTVKKRDPRKQKKDKNYLNTRIKKAKK